MGLLLYLMFVGVPIFMDRFNEMEMPIINGLISFATGTALAFVLSAIFVKSVSKGAKFFHATSVVDGFNESVDFKSKKQQSFLEGAIVTDSDKTPTSSAS